MQISASFTLTLYHAGQFWVWIAERIEDGRLSVARIVFGTEPSDEEILQFVFAKWDCLHFSGEANVDVSVLPKNPKRRQREVAKNFQSSV